MVSQTLCAGSIDPLKIGAGHLRMGSLRMWMLCFPGLLALGLGTYVIVGHIVVAHSLPSKKMVHVCFIPAEGRLA